MPFNSLTEQFIQVMPNIPLQALLLYANVAFFGLFWGGFSVWANGLVTIIMNQVCVIVINIHWHFFIRQNCRCGTSELQSEEEDFQMTVAFISHSTF